MESVLSIAANAFTIICGIITVIGLFKIISNLSVKNETLYGEEAVERYNQIKEKLSKGSAVELKQIEFGGGSGLIVPRLELEKITYNPQTMGDEMKGHKAIVKFYEKDGNGKTMIERWLL